MNSVETSNLSLHKSIREGTETSAVSFQLSQDDLAILKASLSGAAMDRETDVLGWYHALPQLLAEGEEGRFALIHDGLVVSLWDTYSEAMQAGNEKFGSEQFFWTGEIKQREMDHLKQFLMKQRGNGCPR